MNTLSQCQWIEDRCQCEKKPLFGKSYCQAHYNRVYMDITPEMAEYLVEKEVSTYIKDIDE